MNILFLDVDGVINSEATWSVLGNSTPYEYQDGIRLKIKHGLTNFNPVSLKLIEYICNNCNLKVYVHSTWSRHCNKKWFKDEFKRYKVNLDVLNILPQIRLTEDRTDRIHNALSKYKPDKYVILDDEDLKRHFGDNFIWCNPKNGFGYLEFEQIMNLFERPLPYKTFNIT